MQESAISLLAHQAVSARNTHRSCSLEKAVNLDSKTNCMFLGKDGEPGCECNVDTLAHRAVSARGRPDDVENNSQPEADTSIEPYSSITEGSTFEKAFNRDTCRHCVSERHRSRNKTNRKSTCTEQMEPFPAL